VTDKPTGIPTPRCRSAHLCMCRETPVLRHDNFLKVRYILAACTLAASEHRVHRCTGIPEFCHQWHCHRQQPLTVPLSQPSPPLSFSYPILAKAPVSVRTRHVRHERTSVVRNVVSSVDVKNAVATDAVLAAVLLVAERRRKVTRDHRQPLPIPSRDARRQVRYRDPTAVLTSGYKLTAHRGGSSNSLACSPCWL
jgi:hypothetical protein